MADTSASDAAPPPTDTSAPDAAPQPAAELPAQPEHPGITYMNGLIESPRNLNNFMWELRR